MVRLPFLVALGASVALAVVLVVLLDTPLSARLAASSPSATSTEPRATMEAATSSEVTATSTAKAPTKAITQLTAPEPAAVAAALPASSGTASQIVTVTNEVRQAAVNIVCVSNTKALRTISGTGMIIDPRGIIITAAHVGQYSLLSDIPKPDTVVCLIRTGSPAETRYVATPIFVSPSWVHANPDTLSALLPSGTGEDDFALLAITESATTSQPLPTSFPYVPLSGIDAKKGDPVVIGSYGAEFLTTAQVRTSLYPIVVPGMIKDLFTFNTTSVDLLSLGGGAAAQEGSSGGGVVNMEGKLVGVVTTSTVQADILDRDLHAITIGHIRRSFVHDEGTSIDSYLSDNSLENLISLFAPEAHALGEFLVGRL